MSWQDKFCGSANKDARRYSSQRQRGTTVPGAACSSYGLCSSGNLNVSHVVCRSNRSHSVCLGTWSIVFLVVGVTQLSAGIFFLSRLPAIQLGTNFWTGGWNILCSAAILVISFRCPGFRYFCCSPRWPWSKRKSKLVFQGKEFDLLEIPEKFRVKWLLGIGISALLANVMNLIILEVGEWRMAIANEEARFLGKRGFADTMFSAYITATVATSTGVVAGFLCTQFVYCISSNRRGALELEDRSILSANTLQQSIATISGKAENSEMQERGRFVARSSSQDWVYSDADASLVTKIDSVPKVKPEAVAIEKQPEQKIATVRRTHSVFMSAPTEVALNKVSRVQSFKVQPVSTPRVATVQRSKTLHEGSSRAGIGEFRQQENQSARQQGQTAAEIEKQSEVKLVGDKLDRSVSLEDLTKPGPNNKMMKLSTKFGEGYMRENNNRSVSSASSVLSFDKRYPYAKSIELVNDKYPYGDSDADVDTTCDVDTTDAESCDDIVGSKDKKALYNIKQRLLQKTNRRAITPDNKRASTPDVDYDVKRSITPLSDSIKDIAMYGKKADLLKVGNMLLKDAEPKVNKDQFSGENKETVSSVTEAKSVPKGDVKPVKPKRQCERKSSATQTDMSALRTRPRIAAAIKKVSNEDIPEKPQRPPPLPPVDRKVEPSPNPTPPSVVEQRMPQSQSSSGYSSPHDSYEKISPEPTTDNTVCHVQDGASVTVIKIESTKNSPRNATTLHIEDTTKRRVEKPARKRSKVEIADKNEYAVAYKDPGIPKRSRSRLAMADQLDNKSKTVGRSVSFNSSTKTDWMPLSASLLKEMQSTYLSGEEVPAVPIKPALRKTNIKRSASSVTLSDMYKNVHAPYFPYPNLNLFRLQNLPAQENGSSWSESDDRRYREGYERFKQGNYVVSDAEEGTSGNLTELETIEETSLEASDAGSHHSDEQLGDIPHKEEFPEFPPKIAQSPAHSEVPKFTPGFQPFEADGRPMMPNTVPRYGLGNLPSFGYFGGSPFVGAGMGGMNPNQAFAYFAELELMARHLRNQLLYQQAQMAQATVLQQQAPPPPPPPAKPIQREESFC